MSPTNVSSKIIKVYDIKCPPNVESYLKSLIEHSRRILKENLVSVILFGSIARNEASITSDVDVLLIVRDANVNTKKLEKISRLLAARHKLIFIPRGFFGKLFYALSQATGMFRPVFIARKDDIENWRFQKIFRVSKFMSKILAPTNAVKYTISKSYRILYGEDIIKILNIAPPTFKEIIKSLVMNLLLAISSVVLIPLHKKTYKFVYEAVKWSLFNYAYASDKSPSITRLSEIFKNPIRRGMEYFLDTRNNGKLSPGLLLYSIPAILKIHIASIKRLKVSRKIQSS